MTMKNINARLTTAVSIGRRCISSFAQNISSRLPTARIYPLLIVLVAISMAILLYIMLTTPKVADILKTVEAKNGSVAITVTETGYVRPKDEVLLYIERQQTVSKVNFKVGDFVHAGAELVEYNIELDKNEILRKISEAQTNLANAEINLRNIALPADGNELIQHQIDISMAQKNLDDVQTDINDLESNVTQLQIKRDDAQILMNKYNTLYESGAISRQEYDDAVTAYKLTEEMLDNAQVQANTKRNIMEIRKSQLIYAQNKLENAQNKLSSTSTSLKYQLQENIIAANRLKIDQLNDDLSRFSEKTISPLNGNITAINVTAGGTASKGTAVVVISDTKATIVKADIDEYDAPLLELGQRVEITANGLPDIVYHGTISKIAVQAVDKKSSSDDEVVVPVEISLTDADEKLKNGYSVDVTIFTKEITDTLAVPIQALVNEADNSSVFVLKGKKVYKQSVLKGLIGDKTVQILDGLNQGDLVVVNPAEWR